MSPPNSVECQFKIGEPSWVLTQKFAGIFESVSPAAGKAAACLFQADKGRPFKDGPVTGRLPQWLPPEAAGTATVEFVSGSMSPAACSAA